MYGILYFTATKEVIFVCKDATCSGKRISGDMGIRQGWGDHVSLLCVAEEPPEYALYKAQVAARKARK